MHEDNSTTLYIGTKPTHYVEFGKVGINIPCFQVSIYTTMQGNNLTTLCMGTEPNHYVELGRVKSNILLCSGFHLYSHACGQFNHIMPWD